MTLLLEYTQRPPSPSPGAQRCLTEESGEVAVKSGGDLCGRRGVGGERDLPLLVSEGVAETAGEKGDDPG